MRCCKYVIIEGFRPVLFWNFLHKEMSHLGKITSAGFVSIKEPEVICYGESISLGIGVASNDENLIREMLANEGGHV